MARDVLITPASGLVDFLDTSVSKASITLGTDGILTLTGGVNPIVFQTSTSGSSVLRVDGTSGTIFEVTDDLSDSLMSVNTIAGLPVFEVFADNHIVAGRYNQNDFYLDTNGNLGLGTSAPSSVLDVYEQSGKDNKLRFHSSTTGSGTSNGSRIGLNGAELFINNIENNAIKIYTQSTQTNGITILGSGLVGIGTTDPQRLLDVSASGQITFGDQVSSGTSDNKQGIYWHNTDSYAIFRSSGSWSAPNYQQLMLKWATGIVLNPGSGTYGKSHVGVVGGVSIGDSYYTTKYDNGLIVQGDVGIGTASPASKLHVYGADPVLTIQDSESTVANASAILRIGESDTSANLNNNFALKFAGSASGGDLDISRYNNTSLVAQGVRIKHDGNVGIGTTAPTKKLDVNGDVRITGHTVNEGWLQAAGSNFSVGNNSYGVFLGTYSGGTSISPGEVILSTQGKTGWDVGDGLGRIRFFLGDTSGVGVRDVAKIEAVNEVGNGSTTTTVAGGLAFYTSPFNSQVVERLRIGSNGYIGIGTGLPVSVLHVEGSTGSTFISVQDSRSNTGDVAGVRFSTSANATVNFKSFISHIETGSNGLGDLIFAVNNSNTAVDATVSDERMRIDSSGNVGIGTDDPKTKLHIDSGSSIGAIDNAYSLAIRGNGIDGIQILSDSAYSGRIVFGDQGSNNVGRIDYDHSTDAFRFFTNGTEKVSILSGGNVGIGVDPKAKFEVDLNQTSGTLAADNYAHFGGQHHTNGSVMGITLGYREANLLYRKVGIVARGLGDTQARQDLDFLVSTVNSSTSVTPADAKLTISGTTGNVGIGTVSPSQKLHVSGLTKLGASGKTEGGAIIGLSSFGETKGVLSTILGNSIVPGTVSSTVQRSTSNIAHFLKINEISGITFHTGLQTTEDANVAESTNEKMRIDIFGKVGIGTDSPSQKLDVIGRIRSSFNSGDYFEIGSSDSGGFVVGKSGGTEVVNVRTYGDSYFNGGNFGIGTASPAYTLQVQGTGYFLSNLLSSGLTAQTNSNYIRESSDQIRYLSRINGRNINHNAQFINGTASGYSLYNNSGGSATSISVIYYTGDTAISTSAIPNSNGYVLKISYTSGAGSTSPGFGGFYLGTTNSETINADKNYKQKNRIIHRIWAKIPSGKTLAFASNAYGTNGSFTWLTPRGGNGDWYEYIGVQQIGYGGSFSSTSYFYVSGGSNTSFDWYVAECSLIDVDCPSDILYSPGLSIGYASGASYNSVQAGWGGLGVKNNAIIGGSVGIGVVSPTTGFKLDVVGADFRVSDVAGDDGVELGWSAGASAGFVQAYDRGASAFRNLTLNNSVTIEAAGDVGIGTNSPTRKLTVHNSAAGSIANFLHYTDASNYQGLYIDVSQTTDIVNLKSSGASAGGFAFFAGNNEKVRIDSSGNVGIGTDDPQTKLHLSGGSTSVPIIRLQRNDTSVQPDDLIGGFENYSNDADGSFISSYIKGYATETYGRQGYLTFGTAGTNSTDATEKMRIDSSGNVGIGTTSPSQALTVAGKIDTVTAMGTAGQWDSSQIRLETTNTVDTTGWQGISFDTSTTNNYGWSIGVNRSGSGRGSFRVYEHANSVTGTERFTIEQDGNVGIGNGSPTGGKLQVAGKVRIDAGSGNDALNLNAYDLLKWDNSSHIHFGGYKTGQWTVLKFYSSSTERLNISGDVNVQGATDLNINGPSRRLSFASGTGTVRTTTSNKLFLQTNSTHALTIDTSQNVGIGTVTPSQKLHVVGKTLITDDVQLTGSNPRIDFNTNGSSSLRFYDTTNTAERMRINTSGNLGINTTSPTSKLQIVGSTSGDSVLKVDGTNGTLFEVVDDLSDSLMSVNDAAGLPVFEVFADNTIVGGRYNQNDFYLDGTSGNVGIGTASPNKKLEVVDSAAAQILAKGWGPDSAGNDGGAIQLGEEAAFHGLFSYDNATSILYIDNAYNSAAGDIRFRTKTSGTAITAVTIEGDGDVGIGTASPTAKLHIAGSGGDVKFTIDRTDARTYSIYTESNSSLRIKDEDASADRLTILSDGNVGIGTASPSAKLQVAGNTYLNSGSNVWNLIGNNGINFARETYFGYSSSYRILQLGTVGATRAISIGVDVSSNASGSFGGDEIIFPNQREIITPNAADNGYLGLIATDNQNKVRIGNYRWNILTDTPGITIDTSASTNYVGIGTTAPTKKLDVRGDFRLNGAISQYSTAVNSIVENRFWDNTGSIALAELLLYDFNSIIMGAQLSLGQGASQYVTLTGVSTAGGKLTLKTATGSSSVRINGNGDTIFNEGGADYDFRIKGDTDTSLFFVDASTDRIGVGTTSPSTKLQVNGDATVDGDLSAGGSAAANRTLTINSVAQTGRPAAKINNPNLDTATASNGRTFHGWLPIDLDGTVKYIPVYN